MLADRDDDNGEEGREAVFNRRYGYRGPISDQGPTFAASLLPAAFRRDTSASHHFMPLQPMGGGGRTTHRINVITAKSLAGKKSPAAKWTKMPGLQLGREDGRCICIKRKLMTKPSHFSRE